jgi:hypothetical protein
MKEKEKTKKIMRREDKGRKEKWALESKFTVLLKTTIFVQMGRCLVVE